TCRDLLSDLPFLPACFGGVLFVGATAWYTGRQTCLFMELWAGTLIALSLACCRRGWLTAGVAAGVAALFFRELALPHVVAVLGRAAWQGRGREALSVGPGLAALALFMAFHAHEVQSRLPPGDLAMEGGWVRFGGIRFVLATSQTNVFLMALPLWCTAIYV